MRLSEAIRLGAMATRPVKRVFFHYVLGEIDGTCALGAALYANGATDVGNAADSLDHLFGVEFMTQPVRCFDCGIVRGLGAMITHLNDEHFWSRERIADSVETIEREIETKAPETETTEAKPVLA